MITLEALAPPRIPMRSPVMARPRLGPWVFPLTRFAGLSEPRKMRNGIGGSTLVEQWM
jgi:hypothetical protein